MSRPRKTRAYLQYLLGCTALGLMLVTPVNAWADCTVTGTGSVAVPDDGDTVTCNGNTSLANGIGDGTTNFTVVIEDGTTLTSPFPPNAPVIHTNHDNPAGNTQIFIGDNVTLTGYQAYRGEGYDLIYIGDNTLINTSDSAFVFSDRHPGRLEIGNNTRIESNVTTINQGPTTGNGGYLDVILGSGSEIVTTGTAPNDWAILGSDGGDFIENYGLIQGATGYADRGALFLGDWPDTLILRAGSNLVGRVDGGTGGGPGDDVYLYDTGSEDEAFYNFEELHMVGESWVLTGASTFTSGVWSRNGTLYNNGVLTADVESTEPQFDQNGGTYAGTGTTIGNVTNNWAVAPGNSIGTMSITGDYIQNSGAVLEIEIDDAGNTDLLAITGTATINDGTLIVIPATGSYTVGDTYTFITATGGFAGTGFTLVDPLALDLGLNVYANQMDVEILAVTPFESLATSGNDANVGAVLDTLGGSADPTISQIVTNLNSAATQSEVNTILSSVQPGVDTGTANAGYSVAAQTVNIVGQRLSGGHGGFGRDEANGFTAQQGGYLINNIQNMPAILGVFNGVAPTAGANGAAEDWVADGTYFWSNVFGQRANQGARSGINGYDSDTLGVSFGIDTDRLAHGATLGLALTYADTDIEADNANATSTDIKSYQITGYAGKDLAEGKYINGSLSFMYGKNTSKRHNVGGAGGPTATGKFNSYQVAASAEIGKEFSDFIYGATVTPHLNANYIHYRADDYTETGAGGANLSVDNEALNIFEIGPGVDLRWRYAGDNGTVFEPELRFSYRYDLIGDEVATTSRFTGGGASFATTGANPAQSTFNIGAGLNIYTKNDFEIGLNYDAEIKSDYTAHSGFIRLTKRF